MKHKPISKRIRQLVYDKYNGHCAYCGCALEYKDMQVDHIESVYKKSIEEATRIHDETGKWIFVDNTSTQDDSLTNLMPSCRQCNYYKSSMDIEGLRYCIKNQLEHTCIDTFQAKLAIKYGIIEFKPWDGKFYFEKENNNNLTN